MLHCLVRITRKHVLHCLLLHQEPKFPFSTLTNGQMSHSFWLSLFPISLFHFPTSFPGSLLNQQAFESLPQYLLFGELKVRQKNTTCLLRLKDLRTQQRKLNYLSLWVSETLFATWKLAKWITQRSFNAVLGLTYCQLGHFTTLLEQRLICKLLSSRDEIMAVQWNRQYQRLQFVSL